MAQIADTSLEERLQQLEAFARSISAGNLTDLASVVDAAGRYVPLSSIAFGQVGVQDTRDPVTLTGALNTADGTGWVDLGGPYLDVYVSGGRLRVDFAAQLLVEGVQPGGGMSYTLRGPAATQAAAASAPVIAPGDTWRAVYIGDSSSTTAYVKMNAGSGSFGLHVGLATGWYRVSAVYQLGYSSGPTYTPRASFYGQNFAASVS